MFRVPLLSFILGRHTGNILTQSICSLMISKCEPPVLAYARSQITESIDKDYCCGFFRTNRLN